MSDVVTRAIMIGASVFIAIITISAVMTYYNVAQNAARSVGTGVDIAGLKNQNITDSLLKQTVTGTEVKNIINYFYQNKNVHVNVYTAKKFDGSVIDDSTNILSGGVARFEDVNNRKIEDSEFKKLMKYINPLQRFKLTRNDDLGITTIRLDGKS